MIAVTDDVSARPNFKESPFYTIIESLTSVLECKGMHSIIPIFVSRRLLTSVPLTQVPVREATRDHVEAKIIFRPDIADRLMTEPNLKVMIYCAADPLSPFTRVDIAFPHQVEIRVNGDEVKANLRGLKNKPGSTRPADITTLVRKRASYENMMTVTYALTQKVSIISLFDSPPMLAEVFLHFIFVMAHPYPNCAEIPPCCQPGQATYG